MAVVAVIWSSSLGTSLPQRQVLYIVSKCVKRSVGLCFFCGHSYKHDLISVGGHKKKSQTYEKNLNHFRIFCSHSIAYFPRNWPTEICSLFCGPIAVGLSKIQPSVDEVYVCMYVCMYVWSSHIAEYGSTG